MKPPHQILRRFLPKSWYRRINDAYRRRQSRVHTDAAMADAALGVVNAYWRDRIDQVVGCPDNSHIPRHPAAGRLEGGWITMHNGLQVGALGYYGEGILNMLVENKGVHEPQEERAFAEILLHIKPGSTIVEVGAYWAYYSMWFAHAIPGARCFLVEPDQGNLLSGQENFGHNNFTGTFEQAYIGDQPGFHKDGVPVITIDDFCRRHSIDHMAVLHADIQEAELRMLTGASRMLGEHRADYVFVSSHTNELHYACIERLRAYGYHVLVSCDMDETVAGDGVIVARRPGIGTPATLQVAKNSIS
ncbi:MAG: FkbM family methyltransferase [Akkermansiaceae bacterium]|nr:FkbM family methyltransferase [Akkermansiaceae bacterium]MCF7730764.1 FkbM family methyltransferase [Akkermansiaceae bacterium]